MYQSKVEQKIYPKIQRNMVRKAKNYVEREKTKVGYFDFPEPQFVIKYGIEM